MSKTTIFHSSSPRADSGREEQFKLYDQVPAGYVALDRDGIIIEANQTFGDLLALDHRRLHGMDFNGFIKPIHHGLFRNHCIKALELETIQTCSLHLKRADDSSFYAHCSLAGVTVGDDNVDQMRMLIIDVTPQKQILQHQRMALTGRVACSLTHEFNNLMTVIVSYTSFLMQSINTECKYYDDVKKIKGAGKHAANLVRQLMTFSRNKESRPRVLDLNLLIKAMQPLLVCILEDDVQLEFDLDPDLWHLKIDPGQLELAVINLATNAKDAMPQGGKLCISTKNVPAHVFKPGTGQFIRLDFKDTGAGMDEAVQARIFECFYTTKDAGKGTGLGLYTSRAIIEEAAGFIDVASQTGQGTTFKVFLPRDENLPDRLLDDKKTNAIKTGGSDTILVVDDDDGVLDVVGIILRRYGYRVIAAANGKTAIQKAQAHTGRIDLLLSDVVMPDQSGTDVSQQLKRYHPGIKSLFMSGYSSDHLGDCGHALQGIELIKKPFKPRNLIGKIKSMLD